MHHAKEGDCVPELNPELSDHGLGRRQIQDAGSSKQQRCPNTHAHTHNEHTTEDEARPRPPPRQVPLGPIKALELQTW